MRLSIHGNVVIVDGPLQFHLISNVYPLILVEFGHRILLVIEFPLQEPSVLGQTHVGVHEGEVLHLVHQIGLLNIVVGQLVDELVEVLSAVLMSQVFVLA